MADKIPGSGANNNETFLDRMLRQEEELKDKSLNGPTKEQIESAKTKTDLDQKAKKQLRLEDGVDPLKSPKREEELDKLWDSALKKVKQDLAQDTEKSRPKATAQETEVKEETGSKEKEPKEEVVEDAKTGPDSGDTDSGDDNWLANTVGSGGGGSRRPNPYDPMNQFGSGSNPFEGIPPPPAPPKIDPNDPQASAKWQAYQTQLQNYNFMQSMSTQTQQQMQQQQVAMWTSFMENQKMMQNMIRQTMTSIFKMEQEMRQQEHANMMKIGEGWIKALG